MVVKVIIWCNGIMTEKVGTFTASGIGTPPRNKCVWCGKPKIIVARHKPVKAETVAVHLQNMPGGLTIDELADVFSINRASIFRKLQSLDRAGKVYREKACRGRGRAPYKWFYKWFTLPVEHRNEV